MQPAKGLLVMEVWIALLTPTALGRQPGAGDSIHRHYKPRHASAITIIMDSPDSPEMTRLRSEYHLEQIVQDEKGDYAKLLRLVAWAHRSWKHDGSNEPSKPDPLTILEEAAKGKQFRCVEYSIVLAAAARAVGMPSRVLGLKRQDAETAE
jgi:hypothetical protein